MALRSARTRNGLLVAAGILLTVVIVGLGGVVSVDAMATQTVREQHIYAFTGSALSIDLSVGEVQIVPGKDGEVIVARRLTYGLRRPLVEERVDGEAFRVHDGDCPAPVAFPCKVRWLLQVPRNLLVEVSTRAGAITVSGMTGTVKLTSVSGAVKALAPSGPRVNLRSTSGAVTAVNVRSKQVVATSGSGAVSITFRAPPSLVIAKTETGPIGVVLPDGEEAYRIVAQSTEGSKTVTAKTDPDSRRQVEVRSTKGEVSVLQSPEG